MKVLLLIPVFKRPEVLMAVLKRFKFPEQSLKIKLIFCFIISEDDMYHDKNKDTITRFLVDKNQQGFIVTTQNKPVTNKQNKGVSASLVYDWDYLMNFGSDNIFSDDYWRNVWIPMREEKEIIMMRRVCYVSPAKQEAVEGVYSMIGAGRLIRRDIVEETHHLQGGLYRSGMNSGMDTCSYHNILRSFPNVETFLIDKSLCCDVKTTTNINLYDDIKNKSHETTDIDAYKFARYANLSDLCSEITDKRRIYRGF